MVFQNHSLLPWLSVYQNIEMAVKKVKKEFNAQELREHVMKYIELVNLDHAKDKYPAEISGGMKQRVGIARAPSIEPKVLLMQGFGVDEAGVVSMVANKYLLNLLAMPQVLGFLLVGLVLVILAVLTTVFKGSSKGIWLAGLGTVLVGLAVFFTAGFNNTPFYPSKADLQSSLTIYNASSSSYTLIAMTYVALGIPFVLAYVAYVWRQMDSQKLAAHEVMDHEAY